MTSPLLDLSLDSIAAYNSHGEAFVQAIKNAEIAPLHHPVLLGMFAVYSTLIAIGHLDEDDIIYPTYSADRFDPQKWANLGLDETVVSILGLLPYPNDDRYEKYNEPWHLDTSAMALSYLGKIEMDSSDLQPEPYAANQCFDFVERDLVPSHHVRLTCGGHEGSNYIYDTKTGKIIILNYWEYLYEDIGRRHPDSSYTELLDRFYPAKDIMSQWVRNIYDLVYIPLRAHGTLEEVEFEFDRKTGKPLPGAREKLLAFCSETEKPGMRHQDRSAKVNHRLALRNIYRMHGWPDKFDRKACRVALEQFEEERQALEEAVRSARHETMHKGVQYPEEVAPKAKLLAFLQKSAGDLAIIAEGGNGPCKSCEESIRMFERGEL